MQSIRKKILHFLEQKTHTHKEKLLLLIVGFLPWFSSSHIVAHYSLHRSLIPVEVVGNPKEGVFKALVIVQTLVG